MSKPPNALRSINKRVFNPLIMQLAGRRSWYMAVIEHAGRRSGTTYSTPVTALRVPRGFVIGLPYGTTIDWLRNRQVAGGATLRLRGQMHNVITPEIVDAQAVLPELWPGTRWFMTRLGIADFVRLVEVKR